MYHVKLVPNYAHRCQSFSELIVMLLKSCDTFINLVYNYRISTTFRTCFGSTYTKIGTIQRRLAWPLRKDDTQNREAFHIF